MPKGSVADKEVYAQVLETVLKLGEEAKSRKDSNLMRYALGIPIDGRKLRFDKVGGPALEALRGQLVGESETDSKGYVFHAAKGEGRVFFVQRDERKVRVYVTDYLPSGALDFESHLKAYEAASKVATDLGLQP